MTILEEAAGGWKVRRSCCLTSKNVRKSAGREAHGAGLHGAFKDAYLTKALIFSHNKTAWARSMCDGRQ